jgi:ribosomal protein S18 acetylase RimI-like enzyme
MLTNHKFYLIIELIDVINLTDKNGLSIRKPDYEVVYLNYLLNKITENQGKIFLLEINKKICGFVSGIIEKIQKPWSSETILESVGTITDIYVQKEYQKFGYGKILISKIENYLISKKCEAIFVEAFYPNKNARKFYEKMNYEARNIEFMKLITRS